MMSLRITASLVLALSVAWSGELRAAAALSAETSVASSGLAQLQSRDTVPNVFRMPVARARDVLARVKLTLVVIDSIASTGAVGMVERQSPGAGERVPPDRMVRVVITYRRQATTQPLPLAMPNVTGQPLDQAIQTLAGMGIRVGTVSSAVSSATPGTVVQQSPQAGERVPRGTVATLTTASEPPAVAVPNVVGVALDEARRVLDRASLTLGEVTEEISEGVPGVVLRQDPPPGRRVAPRSSVRLTVARRESTAVVPGVVGRHLEEARRILAGLGFEVDIQVIESGSAPPNTVARQSPDAGSRAVRGASIRLVVTQAPMIVQRPPPITVPNVVGQPRDVAVRTLERAGFINVSVRTVESARRADTVVAQLPGAGDRLERGSAASLVVAVSAPIRIRPAVAIAAARAKLDSGNFEESHRLYAQTLQVAGSRADSAVALFGQSFVAQQIIAADSVPAEAAQSLTQSYRQAQRLDSAKYFVSAQHNIGLLLSATGRHGDAADEYLRGARAAGARRRSFLLSGGRELLQAERPADAVRPLREAALDSGLAAEAQTLLLEAYRRTRDTAALLRLADTLRGPSAPLSAVNRVLVDMMTSSEWLDNRQRERCLVLIARNAALLNLGPAYFEAAERVRFDRLAAAMRGTELDAATKAFIDAYRVRRPDELYRPPEGSAWWFAPSEERRAAWSTTLRSIGDWYHRSGHWQVALGFYETAIGLPFMQMDFIEPWVDLEALPPLAEIYGTLPDTGPYADRLARIERFTQALFSGKGDALRANHIRRIRLFRLTLGSLFARQDRWGNGWYGAILQLEDARRLTSELRRDDPANAPSDPPDVFELLAAEYQRRRCTDRALSAARYALEGYQRQGQAEAEQRVAALIEGMRREPGTPANPNDCTR